MLELEKKSYLDSEDVDSMFYDIEKNKLSIIILKEDSDYPQQTIEIQGDGFKAPKITMKKHSSSDKPDIELFEGEELQRELQEIGIVSVFERKINEIVQSKDGTLEIKIDNLSPKYSGGKAFLHRENEMIGITLAKANDSYSEEGEEVTKELLLYQNGTVNSTEGYLSDVSSEMLEGIKAKQEVDETGLNYDDLLGELKIECPDQGLASTLKNFIKKRRKI